MIAEQNIDVVMATLLKTILATKAAIRGLPTGYADYFVASWDAAAWEGFIRRRILHALLRNDPILFASEAVKKAQFRRGTWGKRR